MGVDLAEMAAAGLYDPASPDAGNRRKLLEFLVAQGCSTAEMVRAHGRGRLFALAGDRIVRPDADTYTLAQLADRAGVGVDLVRRIWRAFGLVERGADVPLASPADAEMVSLYVNVIDFLGEEAVRGLARVYGAAVSRIAEAESAVFRSSFDESAVSSSGSELTTARFWAESALLIAPVGRVLDILHRHHVEVARQHFEQSNSYDLARRRLIRLAVGFVDLSGFTALSQGLAVEDLSHLLARLEDTACDVVQDKGGRVVKFIGDAVMVVAPTAVLLADIVTTLVQPPTEEGGLVACAGVAYGELLAQDGDYFGPPVNLAARLVAVAEPGTVLSSAGFAGQLPGADWTAAEQEPRPLRGFTEALPTFTIERARQEAS